MVVVHDDAVRRNMLVRLLDRDPRITVAGEAGDVATASSLAALHYPDILLIDWRLACTALDAIRDLAAAAPPEPRTAVAVLASTPRAELRALANSSSVFIVLKNAGVERLIERLVEIAGGSYT